MLASSSTLRPFCMTTPSVREASCLSRVYTTCILVCTALATVSPNTFEMAFRLQPRKTIPLTDSTLIMTSMFVDTFIVNGQFGVYDIKNRKATLVDTGDALFTGCTTEFIAAAIVAILKLPEEATKNKRIPVAEVRMSGN
ncbi:hypothetical protein V8C35DRAFT_292791, partial [Trichoderma chlorosporum]